jgi:N12 class adenine-specific DNA methylase
MNVAALRTLRTIQREQRPPTAFEQQDMARWSGWGAVSEIFDEEREEHFWARANLRAYLTKQEYAAAARSTLNAHYTDAGLVKSIWAGVQRLGFAGGHVLEPGCGSGNFIAFAPPTARLTGVEVEPVTAGIAAALYPDARILTESFAVTRLAEGSFDLVVGNVPFGNFTLADRRHNPAGHSIHNHFLIKSLRLSRPGGIVAVLTSRYTMDARNPGARREMAALADLLGAVRLPSGAHQRAAGTKVVTDLLILRRREDGREPDAPNWERTRLITVDGDELPVNEYFVTRPDDVLGELATVRGAYRAGELGVRPAGELIPALDAAFGRIAARAPDRDLMWTSAPCAPAAVCGGPGEPSVRPDGFLEARPDGTFSRVAGGRAEPFGVPRAQAAELRRLLALRDTAVALLDAEAASPEDTSDTERLRGELGRRYDGYVAAYGPLNRFSWRRTGRTDPRNGREKMARVRPAQGGFRMDPFSPLVYALENFDPVEQRAAKAAIFSQRVIAPRMPPLGADSPADALAICLDACGEVRLPEIARLLGTDEEQARAELGALVFDEPGSGRLVPTAEYLSGQLRDKLAAAAQAALDDPRFAVTVGELRAAIPRDLTSGEIDARLGAAWIGTHYVQEFLREVLDDDTLRVEHPGGQVWTIRGRRDTVLATSTWGTERCPAPALAQAICEQRAIEVRDKTVDDTWVLNLDATIAAQEKATELAERFSEWVWEEPARAEKLARTYNEKFNGIVLRSYDDVALSLPGLAQNFEPRPHQVAAVARIISEPAVLLAHEVGAGKTAEMVIGAMELRRLSLARKPAVVVPNHMLEQFAREWLQLYPQARVLVARKEDLRGERRRQFVARCATGDWDGIVMSRSAFERIPMSAEEQRAYLDRELEQMREWIAEAKKGEGLSVKRLEAALLRAEERVKAKLDRARDPGITWEATGIDWIAVDEAHGYKALRTPSAIRDAAIDGSMRASDLDMKIDYLRRRNGKRVVTFATATPIANSVTEAYVMQRYLRPDLLEAAGISVFDSWAATFGQVVTQVELAPEGGSRFRLKSRFARFRNIPELLKMWHMSADVKTGEDLNLPAPALVKRPGDGQRAPETVISQPSPELVAYVAELGRRAEAVRSRAVLPERDNMLKVSGDGRKAALDMRLVGQLQTTPGKVDAAARLIADIWQAHRHDEYPGPDGTPSPVRGSLQIVFCDLGTPAERWNVYDYLRGELASRGVPPEQVRFMHEARTDREKAELFGACRSGGVAVIIGSTEKMGVGTNIQTRAVALHHLDAPWRPADVAQREGRILRQGNLNAEVEIFRHVAARSFDGYVWQALERKAVFIAQVMRGRLDVREIEDIGDTALSYTEVKALATGNPLLMDKAKADAELTRLERAERAHYRGQDALRHTVTRLKGRIARLEEVVEETDAAVTRRRDTRGEAFTMLVDGVTHKKRADAGQHLKRLLVEQAAALGMAERRRQARPGRLGGFEISAEIARVLGTIEVTFALDGAPGTDLRMGLAEMSEADASGLVVRLENRLARLEEHKARTLAEISRLRAELAHASDSVGQPFPQAGHLALARDRVKQIGEQLRAAAESSSQSDEEGQEAASAAGSEDADPEVPVDGERASAEAPAQPSDADEAESYAVGQDDVPSLGGKTAGIGGEQDALQGDDEMEHDPNEGTVTVGEEHPAEIAPERLDTDTAGPGPSQIDGGPDPSVGEGRDADQPQDRSPTPDQGEDRSEPAGQTAPPDVNDDQERPAAQHPRGTRKSADEDQGRSPGQVGKADVQSEVSLDRKQGRRDQPGSISGRSQPLTAAPKPEALVDTDVAVALRRMPRRDLALLLRSAADFRLPRSVAIHGSLTSRGPDEPDPGAFQQLNFGLKGIHIMVSTDSVTREGSLRWPRVLQWLQPGMTPGRLQVLDRADHALADFRNLVGSLASRGENDEHEAAIRELTGIITTTSHAVIDSALHAHETGWSAGQHPAQRSARERSSLHAGAGALFAAPDALSDADRAALERVEELVSALCDNAPNAVTPLSGDRAGEELPVAQSAAGTEAMDELAGNGESGHDATPGLDVDQGFAGVLEALSEHTRPTPLAAQPVSAVAFADIRAAFADLRQVLGLPVPGEVRLEGGAATADGPDTDSLRRLNGALAEARACAAWYDDTPEWQRITGVSEAARALFSAIREAAGDYWAEVRRDVRVRGFTRTVAARVTRTISGAASSLARKLEQAGYGHTRASKAMQNLHHAAADCAGRIIGHTEPGSGARMSQVAEIIAELGRAPQGRTGDIFTRTPNGQSRREGPSSPVTLVRTCFPRTRKGTIAAHRVSGKSRNVPPRIARKWRRTTSRHQ